MTTPLPKNHTTSSDLGQRARDPGMALIKGHTKPNPKKLSAVRAAIEAIEETVSLPERRIAVSLPRPYK